MHTATSWCLCSSKIKQKKLLKFIFSGSCNDFSGKGSTTHKIIPFCSIINLIGQLIARSSISFKTQSRHKSKQLHDDVFSQIDHKKLPISYFYGPCNDSSGKGSTTQKFIPFCLIINLIGQYIARSSTSFKTQSRIKRTELRQDVSPKN
jgi:formate/nitrite transporter FocA (FNT family)